MKRALLIVLVLMASVSCRMIRSMQDTGNELFRGEVVAKVGTHKLYRNELAKYIPSGVSAEDSIGLARQRINAWAEDLLLLDMAEEQLSNDQKDVSKELEEYRRVLLKYRYQQLYIDQRLDTLITEEEIDRYYKQNPDRFRLERPVVKARCLVIPSDARSLALLKKKMSSDDDSEVMEVDSLAATTALKYIDASDSWTDLLTLAQDLGTDYRSLQGAARNQFVQVKDDADILHIAYIVDWVGEGRTAPQEYCEDRIRDLILSERKHSLETALEQDLLEDARRNKKFVIY